MHVSLGTVLVGKHFGYLLRGSGIPALWIILGGGYFDRTVSFITPDQSPNGMEEASDNWKDHASVLRGSCFTIRLWSQQDTGIAAWHKNSRMNGCNSMTQV